LKSRKIVVVEDEPDIREVLRYNLEHEGFDVGYRFREQGTAV